MACIRAPDGHAIPFTFPFPGSVRVLGCILSSSNQSALAAVRTVTCCSTSSLARNLLPCMRACMCVCIDALEKNQNASSICFHGRSPGLQPGNGEVGYSSGFGSTKPSLGSKSPLPPTWQLHV